MKKKLSRYLSAVFLVLMAAGCAEDYITTERERFVRVSLNFSCEEPEVRAGNPMIPANENLIYDIWVLQFDAEGIIIGKPEYYPCDEAGELSTSLSPVLREGQGTVCLVANLGKDFEFKSGDIRVDNLTTFRSMLLDAPLITEDISGEGNIGHLAPKNMYMYGYYHGEVRENQSMNILLGRLFLHCKFVFTNNTGASLDDMTVTLGNVPSKTRIPFVDEPLPGDFFTSYEETPDLGQNGLAPGASLALYYYMPENIRPSEENATYITVRSGGKSATLRIGNDSPAVAAGRDYSLNRNNIYKFNLNLR